MAHARHQSIIPVDLDHLFSVITDYERYPEFVEGCKSVKIHRGAQSSSPKVEYHIHLMKDLSYTLEHIEEREKGRMEWRLLQSDFLKVNNGFWQLNRLKSNSATSHETEVEYNIQIEFKIPVPGFILNRVVKASLPMMIKNFEERARKSAKSAKNG